MIACTLCASRVYAQTDTIRYVRTSGSYNNNGRSWATAKNNVQDAINDLRDYLKINNLTSGSVYIAAGTYVPSESTEAYGGSMLNTSFKIYDGIHVYGGFSESSPESKPGDRIMSNGKKCSENKANINGIGTTSGDEITTQWDFANKTVLSGNHSSSEVTYEFDSIRGRYNMTFPASSYHVVWFGTNGTYTTTNDSLAAHCKPLNYPASLDGCVITGGNASSRSTALREHMSFGGGVYMVGNSELRNCTVEKCNATLRGGGVYLDGGGKVDFCYIHTCQAQGVGVVQGYGGGACIDYDGEVSHSHITNCAARCGGGLAICHSPSEYPVDRGISYYFPFSAACVINNNTSSAEGGGIYMVEGGTLNHATVTANNCIGPDVTYYGRRHGRSGGVYIRDGGLIFNSVFWGNKCASNNDLQFATVRQLAESADRQVFVYHTAFMNHDITDWTGVQKEKVFSLDKHNMPVKGSTANFPCFFDPTVNPDNWDEAGKPGAGVFLHLASSDDIPGPRIWHLTSYSALDHKGVQVTDAFQTLSESLRHAHTDYGIVTNPFEPVSTLGALVRQPDPMRHTMIAQQALEGRKSSAAIPTIFVDPQRAGSFDGEDHFVMPENSGISWDYPLHSIGDALMYFRTYLVEVPGNAIGSRAYYHLPSAWDSEGNPTAYEDYDYVQVLVKEGELSTAGPNNYLGKEMRTASIRTLSHMRLYGGYPESLTGTDTDGRDPHNVATVITANILGETGAAAYQNNSAHVLTYVNAEYAIVDGFQLLNGNAYNLETTNAVRAGAGVLVNNEVTDATKRIDMVGNELRNCLVANNSAPKGAAIYVSGDNRPRTGFIIGQPCYAELKVVNCIIRNNTADYAAGNNGIITSNGRAFIDIDHCDIVNNAGYPLRADNRAWRNGEEMPFHGYIRVDNSLVFCNGTEIMTDRTALTTDQVLSVDKAGQDYVFGTYNMFDADLQLHAEDATQPHGFFQDGFTVPSIAGVLPTGMPDEANHPLRLVMPTTADEKQNYCLLTRTDRNEASYPVFLNPARNVGHSVEGDKPMYGGKVSYMPLNTNPCVNAASISAYGGNNIPRTEVEDYDMTDVTRRNFGGEPDIGALEDTDLPLEGTVIYVTPKGAGRMDGSSWSNAIAGNLVYQVGGSYVVDTVNADSAGQYITTKNNLYRGGYAVDYVWHNGTINYVDKQTITQKRIDMTYYEDGTYKTSDGGETVLGEKTNNQTVTNSSSTLTREKTEFIYGEKSGASRGFYRTNLIENKIRGAGQTRDKYTGISEGSDIAISNNREEDFVSGLQFAVEKAASINKDRDKADRVQVWVGNGVYEDYKGYVMRDKVEVYGGFPAQKYKAPSMAERQALVSDEVPLSNKASVKEEEKAQYETILQVFDQRPYVRNAPLFEDANSSNYTDKWAFNSDVILYKDKDFTESGTKTITTETSVTIPVYYRRDTIPAGGYTEYYEVPGGNVEADLSGRILNPGFEQNAGNGNWSNTKAKYGWTDISGLTLAGSTNHCAWIKNNTPFDFYQDIENLEPGLYRVSVQAFNKGKAKDNVKLFANGEERVLMNISDADNAVSVNQTTYAGWFATGKYANNWVDVYVGESGHLRFGLKGTYSGTDGWTVFDNFKLERLSGSEDISTSTDVVKEAGYTDKAFNKEYSTFRKSVLYMPDVCLPTYWPGTISNDNISNERRQNISGNVVTPKQGTGYVVYEGTRWDGFTIRNGFLYDYFANRDGGAGVRMFEGGTLAHCVIKDNANYGGARTRGGGGYCDGRTSQAIGSFFFNNLNTSVLNGQGGKDSNGGGIYMLVGTCYNSLFANNLCWSTDSRGAGIYIEQATFYNNTVAYNTCRLVNKTDINAQKGNGVHQYEGANNAAILNVFNTIFYGNTGPAIGAQDVSKIKGFKNSYIQSTTSTNGTIINAMDASCIIFNNQAAKETTNPFELSITDAPHQNNFRLKDGSGCINNGAIPGDFVGVFPDKDVDFAKRVQDCQIDIGAYEFNAAYSIKPDTTTHPGQAIFYVMFDSPGGDASADSPANAACAQKLQQVLDAAGRYKNKLMTESRYSTVGTPVAGSPDKSWTVEVWLAGDNTNCTTSSTYADWYTPTRSTKHSDDTYMDNTLDYSFIIPHGIQVKGGYEPGYFHTEGGKIVDDRDPLTYRSVLSGKITSSTGAEGQTYHVITFTNDLFDGDENRIGNGNQLDTVFSGLADAEAHRAVVDGVFIEDGKADSPDHVDRIGAAAVVTGYAHIRNCVVQNNSAEDAGGGLYLKPMALVSGTIIKKNSADVGGGVYIEAPASHSADSLAHIYSTTICENTAFSSAGGMWFENTYVRVNSTALWHNTANDYANVSGSFTRTSANTDYPFIYSAVESRRIEGQGNVELSARETEGVRWDATDPFSALIYYPIEMSSTLSRAGMTYSEWAKAQARFTTLDTTDIAGVSRLAWSVPGVERGFSWGTDTLVIKDNDFIEIGARAINKNFGVNVDPKFLMRRLFVMHTDLLNSEVARRLQDNTYNTDEANMYRQLGSSMLNPFHRLGDAFDYIIAARKKLPELCRNARFEIYVEQGTFYPYHNAYGEQDEVRNNTFLVPEAVTIVGGISSSLPGHNYCQLGYEDRFTNTIVGDGSNLTVAVAGNFGVTSYTLNYAKADSIRLRDARHRPMRDYNLNSVVEPWEFERQTILSGNAVSGEDFTHVYHVITVHADSTKIGSQPIKYTTENPNADWRNGEKILSGEIAMNDTANFNTECERSQDARAIIIDGIQITGGYANNLSGGDTLKHRYQPRTYFRGGGILVDGNWTEALDNPAATLPPIDQPAKYNIPLVIRNCQFQDNSAATGGVLYSNGDVHIYSSHFTQNYSQGPITALDQQYIPFSAGGCIAANSYCGIVNVLFDNNEARRGRYPITAVSGEPILDADARQGFGGVIAVSPTATMRVSNCHFMRNKAVAYSAIYNFKPNNEYSVADSMQLAFNSIFWGNEVFEVDNLDNLPHDEAPTPETLAAFETKYKPSRAGVFHYDAAELAKYERLYHEYDSIYQYYYADEDPFHADVMSKLAELREQGNKMEGLYFCSYRRGYGPTGMKPNNEGYLMTEAEYNAYQDPRQRPVPLQTNIVTGDEEENYSDLFSYVFGNNNILINRVNTAPDGPNFNQPSLIAGVDGYMQNADWLISRMNLTTEQGWGHLKQTVTRPVGYYITNLTGATHFDTWEEALAAAQAIDPDATKEENVSQVRGLPAASFNPVDPSAPLPLYNYLAKRSEKQSLTSPRVPIGTQPYMEFTRSASESTEIGDMLRISLNPKMKIEDVYIDMGVYEYQYIQLDIEGNDIDTVWVATRAKDPRKQSGLRWETPTTDLQGAIDLLMSSHNNHDKYVCFLGDEEGGSIVPNNVIDNRRAFVITSNSISPLMPDSAEADTRYAVKSLNFLGGYSYDVKDAPRDPMAHPTLIEMPPAGSRSQRNQLFIIEDMTREQIEATWAGEQVSRDSVVIPVTFDGITFSNPYSTRDDGADAELGGMMSQKGGAAIYYRWQRQYEGSGGVFTPNFNLVLHPDSAEVNGTKIPLPKLTISNCKFMDNGDRTVPVNQRSSAVRIDHGGGSSLIVNSLFHSNAGAPVYARRHDELLVENDLSRAPNDVTIMNSTFALNDGHLTLESEGSEIHNSLIWLDDLAADTLTQLEIHTDRWDKTTNKSKPGIAGRVTNNAIWGCFQDGDETHRNEPLSTGNYEVFEGPCFINPNILAATSDQRRARDFRLNPGVRTLNMADTTLYRNRVFFRIYPDTCAETHNKFWRRSNGFKSVDIVTLRRDSDLAAKPRLFGEGMERGAYECQAVLQRVVYVQPNMPAATAGDGSSWRSPFGQGQLQNALDVAALYTYMNREIADRETRKSYVFVKGSYDANDVNALLARDGVNIYGSLPGNFNDTAWIDPVQNAFTNAECQRYVNYVRAVSSGVASPNATPTRISTLEMPDDDAYNTGFLLDGFVFTNPGETLTETPVVLNDAMAAVRNCIITENTVIGAPVVDVRKGLLYNSLLYNNTSSTAVKLGANGLALNNTVVTKEATDTPIDLTDASADASVNNIAGHTSELHCFAPYLSDQNVYTLPAYLTSNGALAYQLHEHSSMINAGTEMDALPAAFAPYKADSTVHFGYDRDLLGNPRRVHGTVDMGAYETWRVAPKQAMEITALTNAMLDETDITIRATDQQKRASFLQHYGGNQYPHAGSVVYLMDSSALTMQYETLGDFTDFDGNDIILRPGYMLLKPGASFYGNGHNVQMNYVAAEKRFLNQQYSMTAFPFAYSVADALTTRYYSADDSIAYLTPPSFGSYTYNGIARSAKDYVFKPNNSALWQPVTTTDRTATDGYLMDFGTAVEDTVIRFTGFGASAGEYVYSEDGDDKIVYLDQHDNRIAGTGESLNFTRQEDMGWNMKGLPWLVSGYRTDTVIWADNYLRQMHIPHVLYQMDGVGDFYQTVGDNVYTTRSWDKGNTLSIGTAFLTQTATTQDREAVLFHLPLYFRNEKASRPLLRFIAARPSPSPVAKRVAGNDNPSKNSFYSADILTAQPDSTTSKKINYSYGRDGLKWQANEDIAQIYMLDNKRQSRISLLGAAPTEVDIPLGVKIPESAGETNSFIFNLPEKEAFADYSYVWLIDYKRNRYTNLLDEDCEVSLEPGENNTRFALRIGGFPKTDEKGKRQYVVYSHEGTLFVRGLVPGDKITIYSPSGKLVHSAVAADLEWSMPLFYQNGYVVKVNDVGHKVLNM